MRRRVATPDELERAVRRFGPQRARVELRRHGLIPPIAGASGFTLVQSKGHGTSSASSVTVPLSSTTAGNYLVAFVATYNSSSTTGLPSPPTSWTRAIGAAANKNDYYDFLATDCYIYPSNPGGITSVVIAFSSSASSSCAMVQEWSGVSTASGTGSIDVSSLKNQNPNTTAPSTSVTTTAADLVIGCLVKDDGQNGAGTITEPGSPWSASVPSGSVASQNDSIGGVGMGIAYINGSSVGSITYNPTNSISTDYTLYEIGFLAAGGGGPASIPDLIMAPMVAS